MQFQPAKNVTLWMFAVGCFTGNHASAQEPDVRLNSPKQEYVEGEPVVLDFAVSNPYPTEIHARIRDDLHFAQQPVGITVHREGKQVAGWAYRAEGAEILHKLRDPATGQWLQTLSSGAQLRCRRLALPLNRSGVDGRRVDDHGGPLPPGHYTVLGFIGWIDRTLETSPIEVEIVPAATPHDQGAAELVDPNFERFMCQDQMSSGITPDGQPTDSVKEILEKFPDSVHARLARSRLLLLQARRVRERSYPTDYDSPAARLAAAREFADRIEQHLTDHPDDPLKLDHIWVRFHLLNRIEDVPALNRTVQQLKASFPESGHSRAAEKLLHQWTHDPGE